MLSGPYRSEREEYLALQREHDELLAEADRLRAELSSTADGLGHVEPPEDIARQLELDAAVDLEERAQLLTEAADYWVMAGDAARAERLYRQAIADGGFVAGDARVWYASFLLGHGKENLGLRLLDTVFDEGVRDWVVYEVAGELFEERGELEQALRWFEAGVARLRLYAADADPGTELARARLDGGRSRVRRSLGMPEDLDAQHISEHASAMLERVAFDQESAWRDDRAAQAAELSRIGSDRSRPPGRNEPCWCGSGRKYKKCCGRPG